MNQNKATEANEVEYIEDLGLTDKQFTTATEVVDYLLKAKKITEETIGKYDIGLGLFNELVIPCTGTEQIFNADALLTAEDKPIVITDSAIDAMSIEQCGGSAIAIKDRNYKALLNAIKGAKAENKAYVISFNNDDMGITKGKELESFLIKKGIEAYRANIAGAYKTVNEALQNNENGLKSEISMLDNKRGLYDRTSVAGHINRLNRYLNPDAHPFISTGIDTLDIAFDGGFYPGLYILGAITGLGKTTFALQLMDNIAKQGRDVIIVALEMSEDELMARSISRLTFINSNFSSDAAINARGILNGGTYDINSKQIKGFNEEKKALIEESMCEYCEYAEHIHIIEKKGKIGVKEIEGIIVNHISVTNNKPIVLLDYLQIMDHTGEKDDKKTDKQIMDDAIGDLKQISRTYGITIFAISSLNRGSYNAPIGLEAFKESGAIEYSGDVLMGLDYFNKDGKPQNSKPIDGTKDLTLRILKQRNGRGNSNIPMKYFPAYNYYSYNAQGEYTDSNEAIPKQWTKKSK